MRGDDRGSKTNRAEVRSDPECGLKTNESQGWGVVGEGGGGMRRRDKKRQKQSKKAKQVRNGRAVRE